MNQQIEHYERKLQFDIDSADLFDALKEGQEIIVIDARKKDGYAIEHIPGAMNLPHREMSEESTANLDKSKQYITYCDGIGCNASTQGALKMAKLGFQVKELIGGLDWWKRDGYSTEGTNAVTTDQKVRCYC